MHLEAIPVPIRDIQVIETRALNHQAQRKIVGSPEYEGKSVYVYENKVQTF